MADTKREIERKYEADESAGLSDLPDLTRVSGVSAVIDKGVAELDATYYDTPDQRLAAASLTLRRRTGGDDAGWHLKLPVSEGVRDEIHAPLSDTVPRTLSGLVRSRVRDAELVPVVRLQSARDIRHLVDDSGACSPRSASTAYTPSGSAAATAPSNGPRSRSSWPTTATPPFSTRSRRSSARPASPAPSRRPSWPGP